MSDPNSNVTERVRVALQRAMTRIKELESKEREPVAVIGMACRFPGGPTPDAFWSTLLRGQDMIREVPDLRGRGPWPRELPRWAGLLEDVQSFDAAFFGISPREAIALDPQQRLLLEVTWEAIEHSGIVPIKLNESNTGVFIALCSGDYQHRIDTRSPAERDVYATTGNMMSTAAGRISYVLGLRGPAMTIDTACSSSLVAVHLACQSLRSGESELAIAGGVNLILSEKSTQALALLQALSPDGRCRTFDAGANGFVRGEGCGMIVLKRLSAAQRDGDTILGIIRGSAVNQDGRSTGLTAPNVLAQQQLLRRALELSRIEARELGYLECHGTGTALGDPIETEAIKAVFGASRNDHKLWLGAVKTNIGHLEAAAGIAGLIKILLAFHHRTIPPNLHLRRLNPRITLTGTALTPVTEAVPWSPIDGRYIAGVSSFGISGTNAHVIVEGPPAEIPTDDNQKNSLRSFPLVLSGRSQAALEAQAACLQDHLKGHSDLRVVDLAHSLANTRTHFEHRACFVVDTLEHLTLTTPSVTGCADGTPKLAFLFAGQGAQVPRMGAELHEVFPAFRDALDDVCSRIDQYLDIPLCDVMFAAPGSPRAAMLDQTAYTQPVLFAFQVALFRLLDGLGLKPQILLGHSIGELTAACVAGVLSLDDACKLVTARGKLMQSLPAGGAMVSIQASEAEVRALLEEHPNVDIAALNGPMSIVVSGDEDTTLALARRLEEQGRKTRRLAVSHAFHSRHMDGMLDEFAGIAASLTYHPPRIPVVSNVTGCIAKADELCSPDYWVHHVRAAVRFADGVRTLEASRVGAMLELGHGVLTSMAAACLPESGQGSPSLVKTLHKNRSEPQSFVAALGALHCRGVDVDWPAFFDAYGARRIALPTYAFQRRKFWLDAEQPAMPLEPVADDGFWRAVTDQDVESLARTLAAEAPDEEAAIARILPRLSSWRARSERLAATASLQYAVHWKPVDASVRDATSDTWLIVAPRSLADEPSSAALLRSLLNAGGHELLLDGSATRAQVCEAVEDALARRSYTSVMSLLALDESTHHAFAQVSSGLALNVYLAQAFASLDATARLWFVTQNAASVGPSDPLLRPIQSMTWGLASVFSLEHPRRWGGIVDLPAAFDFGHAQLLAQAFSNPADEDQLVVRSDGIFARRLVRAPVVGNSSYEPHGTILITGGTGALGACTARWLARSGAEHLVLTSRRGSAAEGADQLRRECEALGARVTIVACDVADKEALATVWADLHNTGERLTAVFHAAGISGSLTSLADLDIEDFVSTLSAKVSGAMNIDTLSRATPVDAFVSFSSIAGVWGSSQQAAYAAANAYLDALANHRRGLGLAATSIAWGPWSGDGMFTADAQAILEARGVHALDPDLAILTLGYAVKAGTPSVVVANVDWSRFGRAYTAARPRHLLDEIAELQAPDESSEVEPSQAPTLLAELALQSESDRFGHLLSAVGQQVAAVLQLDDGNLLSSDASFSDLGLDSIMAVELRDRLQHLTGLTLASTVAFDHSSLRRLTTHLLERLVPEVSPEQPSDSVMQMIRAWHSDEQAHISTASTNDGGETLRLIRGAIQANSPEVASVLIDALNATRAAQASARTTPSAPVRLASAGTTGAPNLYCIPSLACPSSPLQFARLAPLVSTRANVWANGNPGYGIRETLPSATREFSEWHTDVILRHLHHPVIVLGYSSGGWVAMDVAAQLAAAGRPPAGLVLLDPMHPSNEASVGDPRALRLHFISQTIDAYLSGHSIFSEGELLYQICSMVRAFDIYMDGWTAPVPACPTLFVHAEAGFPIGSRVLKDDPNLVWGRAIHNATVRNVVHDHADMIASEVATTATVVADWVASLMGAD